MSATPTPWTTAINVAVMKARWPDRVTIYRDHADQWRWRWQSGGNWKVTGASTQGYKNREDCIVNLFGQRGTPRLRLLRGSARGRTAVYEVIR